MKKRLLVVVALLFIFAFSIVGVGFTMKNNVIDGNDVEVVETLTTAENRTVQTKLKRWGYYSGSVDGIYGSKTKQAVKDFQRKNGLAVDGIVGPKRRQHLE